MPKALPTRHDLEQQLLTTRATLLRACRQCDYEEVLKAEAKCDHILDQLLERQAGHVDA